MSVKRGKDIDQFCSYCRVGYFQNNINNNNNNSNNNKGDRKSLFKSKREKSRKILRSYQKNNLFKSKIKKV